MKKINPDYLLKDELDFKVRLRDEVLATEVADLCKQLRGLVRSGKALVTQFEDEAYAERDLDVCKLRADELLAQSIPPL